MARHGAALGLREKAILTEEGETRAGDTVQSVNLVAVRGQGPEFGSLVPT